VGLSAFAVANFALVFALLALGGRELVVLAAVAAKAEMCTSARTLRLRLGLIHCRRHVPSFPGPQRRLRLQRGWRAGIAELLVGAVCVAVDLVGDELRGGPGVA
jgi:hypothetical protein